MMVMMKLKLPFAVRLLVAFGCGGSVGGTLTLFTDKGSGGSKVTVKMIRLCGQDGTMEGANTTANGTDGGVGIYSKQGLIECIKNSDQSGNFLNCNTRTGPGTVVSQFSVDYNGKVKQQRDTAVKWQIW